MPTLTFYSLKLSIVIPAFNEEKTIGTVIKEIPQEFASIDKKEIIVIDDGSTDKTIEIAEKCGAKVYSFSENRGLAKAIAYGFAKAIEIKSDILVILDADNQYDSKEIPLLLEPIIAKKADIVLGDRQVKTLDHMPLQKKIGNRISSKIVSKLIGQKINDAQTGFRALNLEALTKLQIMDINYTKKTYQWKKQVKNFSR